MCAFGDESHYSTVSTLMYRRGVRMVELICCDKGIRPPPSTFHLFIM